MAMVMPMSRTYGGLYSFLFGFLSIAVYDMFTVGFGVWTLVAGIAYGLVGFGASVYFANRTGWKSYAKYAFFATIVFDLVTGLSMGPLFFGQPFLAAVIGQIPFTAIHLLSNVSFAIVLSPMIEKWVMKESSLSVKVSELVRV
ncbi:MAG: hypothetical protein RL687_297 [Candidatus Parcubacteria bacterium]|jgi:uncharacterized membrane protein